MNRLVSLLRLASLMLCAALLSPSANATTYYVATTGSDSNPGAQAKPFQTIGKAVTISATGDTVLVTNGIYTGAGNYNIDLGAKDLVVKSVSGNPANCVIDCQQVGCAFILQNNQTTKSNIAGFTIENGTGYNVYGDNIGGGICIAFGNLSPVVSNCVFIGNTANVSGGGMSGGTATNCTFTGNSAMYGYGGGMADGTAIDCTFTGNKADGGGGMANGTAFDCTFTHNFGRSGGGMSGGTATNCIFFNNAVTGSSGSMGSTYGGGGMSGGTATNCAFTGNSSTYGVGGGMFGGTATNCTFFNNAVTGNSSIGGGAYNTFLYCCTLVGNFAQSMGGGLSLYNSSATNCIVWGNIAVMSSSNVDSNGGITYSDIQGGYSGAGNINSDPLFVNQTSGNLHLKASSPCINAATSTVPTSPIGNIFTFPTTDLDGGKRTIGVAPDMGAYEYGNVGVFGTLAFDSISSLAPAQNVTFQFRPVGGGAAINQTYLTTSDGAFYFYGIPDGAYNLWVKSPTYLSALVPVTVTGGVASITATLEPGDANNDNSVDSTDFGILIGAFGSDASIPGSGYVAGADFNGDGSVDSTDFGLLIGNFNTVGDQ